MTTDQQPPVQTVASTVLALALPLILTVIAAALILRAFSLPFDAGAPFVDVLVPIGAVGFAAAALVTVRRGLRRHQGRRGVRAVLLVEAILAALVMVAGLLTLLLIYALCGLYWTRDTC